MPASTVGECTTSRYSIEHQSALVVMERPPARGGLRSQLPPSNPSRTCTFAANCSTVMARCDPSGDTTGFPYHASLLLARICEGPPTKGIRRIWNGFASSHSMVAINASPSKLNVAQRGEQPSGWLTGVRLAVARRNRKIARPVENGDPGSVPRERETADCVDLGHGSERLGSERLWLH